MIAACAVTLFRTSLISHIGVSQRVLLVMFITTEPRVAVYNEAPDM